MIFITSCTTHFSLACILPILLLLNLFFKQVVSLRSLWHLDSFVFFQSLFCIVNCKFGALHEIIVLLYDNYILAVYMRCLSWYAVFSFHQICCYAIWPNISTWCCIFFCQSQRPETSSGQPFQMKPACLVLF